MVVVDGFGGPGDYGNAVNRSRHAGVGVGLLRRVGGLRRLRAQQPEAH